MPSWRVTAAAVLLVQKAELASPAAPEVIARTYKLTPAELRVLLAVSELGGVAEIADAFGISETTVKSDWSAAKAWLLHEIQED